MPVPTLYTLSKTRLIANIPHLTDIGDLPYDFLAPILRHIQSPAQLLTLETNCPQLVGETGSIWLRFIQRDIPNWETKPHQPRNPANWSKVYRKLKKESEREKEEQEERLREQMRALTRDREGNSTKILEGRVVVGDRPRRTGGGWGGTSSGAPAKTGKAAFDKLKRGMFDQKRARPKAAKLPAHVLEQRKGVVARAPARMVRLEEATPQPPKMLLSRKTSSSIAKSKDPATAALVAERKNSTKHAAPFESLKPVHVRQGTVKSPERPSLPTDKTFSVPRVAAGQSAAGAGVGKRRREEPNPLMAKRRKV